MTFRASETPKKPPCPPPRTPLPEDLKFGAILTPNVLQVDWTASQGWGKPYFRKTQKKLLLSYSCSGLHYALSCFEGMKVYRDPTGGLRLFRPDMHAARFLRSALRLTLPGFDETELVELIKIAVRRDQSWMPQREGCTLYVRPTLISTDPTLGLGIPSSAKLFLLLSPVGPYYNSGTRPISLLVAEEHIRSWPGGAGSHKLAANYGPTIYVQKLAERNGCSQVLWLGPNRTCTEAGSMNLLFVLREGEHGSNRIVVTSPILDTIVPGVTRDSILQLLSSFPSVLVEERSITIEELLAHHRSGVLREVIGCGTAALITSVDCICYNDERYTIAPCHEGGLALELLERLDAIQRGVVKNSWSVLIE